MESGQGQDGEGEGVFLINQGVMRGMWGDKGRGWGTGWGGPGASSGRRPELEKQTQGGGKRKHSGASGLSAGCQRCHVEAARPKLIWEVFPSKGEAAGRTMWTEMCHDGRHLSREKKEEEKKAARVNSHFFFFNWHVTQHGLYTASYPGKEV